MKAFNTMAALAALILCAAISTAAQQVMPTDSMTPYRTMAADTLAAVKAHDMTTAKKKARELEVAWDGQQKALQKKSPDVWNQVDKAMDDLIKPVMKSKTVDEAKVQSAYDAFLAKLQVAASAAH